MGQTFRWRPLDDGWFSGVVGPHLFHVRQIDGVIEYEAASLTGHEDEPDQCLRRYFRLDDDIDAIYASIARDPKVATIMREFPGLRILRQDPWESLASQFCAERTDLGYTEDTVEYAAKLTGTELRLGEDVRYTFPHPGKMSPITGCLMSFGSGCWVQNCPGMSTELPSEWTGAKLIGMICVGSPTSKSGVICCRFRESRQNR